MTFDSQLTLSLSLLPKRVLLLIDESRPQGIHLFNPLFNFMLLSSFLYTPFLLLYEIQTFPALYPFKISKFQHPKDQTFLSLMFHPHVVPIVFMHINQLYNFRREKNFHVIA